ncbi:MAG TPA: PAS domain S-box protein [Candidatus Binataceae bacterium]|nr:PAS domain S-box protein [Candidatus Binataceae bacterium]
MTTSQPRVAEQVAFLESILEGSTEYSIVAKDLKGTILAWNEGARRIYGYEQADVLGKSAFILHHPEDVEKGVPQKILNEVRHNGKWSGELRRVRKNGTVFKALVSITLRRNSDGQPLGFTMISQDLTESQRILDELKESHEYNRGLIESNIDALMTTDPLGIISDVNRQMCLMTGYSREQLIGSPFKHYFTDPTRAEDGIRLALSEDRVTNYELVMRAHDGAETVVSYNATTFRASDGKLKGVFAAARDITAQKRLEEELRQSQNYTRGLIEASVDALLTVDPELRITDVNEQTSKMTGYSREELIGSSFTDYFTDGSAAAEGVRKTLAEGFVTNYVLVLRPKSGSENTVSFNASIFKDTEGRVRGIFASARDITEQKRLEEELRQAQNYTRGLIESSVDPMITVSPDLLITDVNEQMVRITELARERLIGSRFNDYFAEPERAAAGVRKTLAEGFVTNYELTLRTPSGRATLVSFNASVFRGAQGEARGIFAVARDVTEQRRLEEQLREQQNYSRNLIEASVDALVTVDPQGRITDVNEQMVRLAGDARQRLVDSPFASYFTEPERAASGVRTTLEKGVVQNYELVLKSKNGTETQVSFNAAVFRDTAGRPAGIFAAARDVTAQKKLERELREQQTYNRSLIESNIDALMTTDLLGVITDVNRQMCALTKREPADLIGTAFKEYFSDPRRAEDAIRQVLSLGQVTNYELTLRAADGAETVVSYNATTLRGEDGSLRGVFAAARDITAQKHLERQLRQAQEYNRGLIESSVDAMLTVAPDLTITDVNEQMVRLTGYSREELIGTSFQSYFTEPERASAGVMLTLSQGYVTNYELLLRSRHRREFLVSFNASVFKDMEGKVQGIFAVARDVTEQRRLEEQLRESQIYNRGLIESSVDALVTVDPELTITDVNEQMIKLSGYSREELIGSIFKDYFTDPERAAGGVRRALSEGAVNNYELALKSFTGKRTVVSFNAGVFKNAAGQTAGIFAAARDITEQKRLEDQLREQQNYNRSLIESSIDALLTVDPQGVIADVNEQTAKLTGYSRKQLIGSPFVNYFTDPELARDGVEQTFREGLVTNYELVLRSRSGRKIPVSFNAAVFRDMGGAVSGILAAARDITRQKQIEQVMREQQTYTRSLIESNIDALMTTDTLGIITDVNLQMAKLTGRSNEELIGTPFKNYFTDPHRAEDGIRRVLAEDRVTNYELTMEAKDGKRTVVSYNATTFRDAAGRLKGVFAAARDITAQKSLEEQIRKQNRELTEATAFLNNVLESSTEYSIIAMDLDGRILAWNEGARRNYGYGAEEMVGKGDSRVLHTPEDIESGKLTAFLETATRTGKAEGVFDRVRKSGERFIASVAMTLRRDTNDKPIGFVLISKDITGQKRLEEQLRRKNLELEEQNRRVQQANRLKSEFLANMSHELRTPLNSIIGFSELLHDQRGGPTTTKQNDYVTNVLTSARHLLQLINDVLDLSKVESGKMDFFPELVDLAELVGEVRSVLAALVSRKRMQLAVNIDPDVKSVVLDPAKLKQVLFNYLSNAIKFTPEGGSVTVSIRPQTGDRFRLEVSDTGIGIKAEDISRLFVEFQQLDASASKKYQGTGLGLALTKRIVEAQGGEVGVSSSPGGGSTFFAVLPRVHQVAGFEASSEQQPLTWDRAGRSILAIEDNDRDRAWLLEILRDAGYSVEAAATGAEALAALASRHFDAITLDLFLPDTNGWDLLRKIRAVSGYPRVPVIVVSVLANEGKGLAFPVHDFLEKPVDRKVLLAALERAGLDSKEKARVMLVGEDSKELEKYGSALAPAGFKVLTYSNGKTALREISKATPDVLVIDLLMDGINGFEFLSRLRKNKTGKKLPVIVLTEKRLAELENEALRAATSIVAKESNSVEHLIAEIDSLLVEAPPGIKGNGADNRKQPILVVEDNDDDRTFVSNTLTKSGYEVLAVSNGADALDVARTTKLAGMVVDLSLPDIGGRQLIQQLHAEKLNAETPVVIASICPDIAAAVALPIADYLVKPLSADRLIAALAAAGAGPKSGARILVVDDDAAGFEPIETLLNEWGYKPLFAANGTDALSIIEHEKPFAIVVDLMMPEMSGLELLHRLRAQQENRDIHAIVMTAKDLTREERLELKGLAQTIVQKGSGSTLDMLEALSQCGARDRGTGA